jgi:hypothetical protein
VRFCEQAWSAKTSLICDIKQKGLGVLKSGLICEIMRQIKLSHSWMSVCLFMVKEQSIWYLFSEVETQNRGRGTLAQRLLIFQNSENTMAKERRCQQMGNFSLCWHPLPLFFPQKKLETSQHGKKRNLRTNNNALVTFFLTLQRSFWRSEGRSLVSLESRLRNKRTPSWLICSPKKNTKSHNNHHDNYQSVMELESIHSKQLSIPTTHRIFFQT